MRRAASSFVRCETDAPCSPVAQFALPAFTTTARIRPFEACRFFLERVTGAATTRFCVKTAAADAGTSLEMSARSRAPVFFNPHAAAAKRNPLGSADSGGAWVISLEPWICFRYLELAQTFQAQRQRREPIQARFRRELFWKTARLRH